MDEAAAPVGVPAGVPATRQIPEATVARLAVYLRVLDRLPDADRDDEIISSEELAVLSGVNSAKLRKDLSYLGTHGTRGVGYDIAALTNTLRRTLGAHEVYPVAIVGVGHLGSALAGYRGFAGRGFPIRALLDSDPTKVGTEVAGIIVSDIAETVQVCRSRDIAIGIVATPESAAQQVADVLITAGIRSILNFSPGPLTVPGDVELRRVDLALELQMLAFHESRRERVEASP